MKYQFLMFCFLYMCSVMSMDAQHREIVSPRIYYHEEKLLGEPVETKHINREAFDFILRNARSGFYKNPEIYQLVLVDGEFDSVRKNMFAYSTIRKDGIPYDADEGSFYLPEAIIFYDEGDYTFPSEFYFIAKIKGQLELCRCSGGADIKWYQIPDRVTVVTDPQTIQKIENTMEELKGYIEYEVEEETQEKMKKAEKIASRQPLSPEKRAAYIELTNICMPKSLKRDSVLTLIEELKEFSDDDEYDTTYDYFRLYLNHHLIPFIITLDWKESVDEMEAWVSSATGENFGQSFEFVRNEKYDEESTVSDDDLFADFDRQLRKIGLQLTLIDTSDKDEYELIIHPGHALDKIRKALKTIGVSCQDF